MAWINDSFYRLVSDLDKRSTVGYCSMSNYGTTVGQVLGWDGVSYSEERLDYLRQCVTTRMQQLFAGEPVADDIKVFVKQEPHKIAKLEEERYRLISAVSLVDTMVDRMLLEPIQKQAIKSCTLTPVMMGYTPMIGGHFTLRTLLGESKQYLSLDKSAWDWSVPGWLIDAIERLMIELNPNAPNWWRRILRMRHDMLFENCVYRFQDGVKAYQPVRGVMKSGCYGTLMYNSVGQLILEVLARLDCMIEAPLPLVFGDDSISVDFDDSDIVLEYMKKKGFVVKVTRDVTPEFIGFWYYKDHFEPAYEPKHEFALQHLTHDMEIAAQTLGSYQLLYYAREDVKRKIRKLAYDLELHDAVWSDRRLLEIADGL